MSFCKMLTMAALTGVLSLTIAGTALASPSSVKDCSVCQFKPAIPTTTTKKSSSTTSKTHIHAVTTLTAQTRQYQQVKHRIVAINIKPGGVSSLAGCVDPVQRGWISAGGQFKNSRLNGGQFWDKWQAGRMICRAMRVKIGNTFWMRGYKDNCGNEIWIQVAGPRTIHKIIPVVTFRTVKSFRKAYDKWITKTTTSTSTGTTTTTFSCNAYGSGWTLTTERGANECKLCPPTPCPTPTPPPPPSKAHAWLSKSAYKDGSLVSLNGGEFTFSITVNGTSSGTTTNAASGQSKDLGQFNAGDSVQVCETNSAGYTPDQQCISHTMAAGENFTFLFVNRKSSPPPPPPPTLSCSNVTQPEDDKGGVNNDGETYPGTVTVSGTKQGDIVQVQFQAGLGSGWITSQNPFTATGLDTPTWIYQAPNDQSSAGQSDTITILVVNKTTGQSTSCSSRPFLISTAPSNPSEDRGI